MGRRERKSLDEIELSLDEIVRQLKASNDCIDNERAVEMIEAMHDMADWMLDNGDGLTPNVHFALNQIYAAYALAVSGPTRRFKPQVVEGGADHRQSEQSEDWPWPS